MAVAVPSRALVSGVAEDALLLVRGGGKSTLTASLGSTRSATVGAKC